MNIGLQMMAVVVNLAHQRQNGTLVVKADSALVAKMTPDRRTPLKFHSISSILVISLLTPEHYPLKNDKCSVPGMTPESPHVEETGR